MPESCAFRVFYVCGRSWGGGDSICPTMTVSSLWHRLHTDPMATKQRWYCPTCQAKYKTTNGVLVEVMHRGTTVYSRAEFPDDAWKDVKACAVQEMAAARLGRDAANASELLANIPEAHPFENEWLRPVPSAPGSYMFHPDTFKSVPILKWEEVFSLLCRP